MLKKILLSASLCAFLSPIAEASGWSQGNKIVEVYNHGWTVMIRMDGDFVDRSGGRCSGTQFYSINKSSSGFDPIFSQIMLAYAANKTVKLWLDGNCTGQGSKYQNFTSIRSY
tara:strand:- start:168 stop:506 length:339 start_codon:yes stop_codon:yes gene_type:complete